MDAPSEMDAPDAFTMDAPIDVGVDAGCGRRADCDSNGSCETMLGSITNCQACAVRCVAPSGASATCDFETGCGSTCNAGQADCDGAGGNGCEVNTNTTLAHCGGCGMACETSLLNARATCTGGDCLIGCQTGFADCNADLTDTTGNGCEINTTVSLAHCGGCGRVCALPSGAANATPSCSGSMCRLVCNTGFRDCDGDQSNGCETVGVCPG